jgi:hypothetical protein
MKRDSRILSCCPIPCLALGLVLILIGAGIDNVILGTPADD